jgi:hypothetical protein
LLEEELLEELLVLLEEEEEELEPKLESILISFETWFNLFIRIFLLL